MSYFQQMGDQFRPTAGRESLLEELPVGNYIVAQDMMGLFYLRVSKFAEPGKMYGDINSKAERIMKTFLDREGRPTGVLMSGEKGSGKSQLARVISRLGYDAGIPTILVNAPFVGDQFANLLASVEQPAIILMDEFEKVYDKDAQPHILTLLDGTIQSQKLFLLTVNDQWGIDSHMKNRPGRLYYHLEFDGLGSQFVREYAQDLLNDKEQVEAVVRCSVLFQKFNFDMLKALVEEMNRYDQDPWDALEFLNAKPVAHQDTASYEVEVWSPAGDKVNLHREDWEPDRTPLTQRGGLGVMYRRNTGEVDEDNDPIWEYEQVMVHAHDAVNINAEDGIYEFVTEDKHRVVFTKKKPPVYDWRKMGTGAY